MIYNELMSDFEMDEKDFAADSWSLAVDSSFLQQHKKEVMKQQDVIYGEQDLPEILFLRQALPVPFLCQPPAPRPFPLTPLPSEALPLSLHSGQFLVFTLCQFHARHHARAWETQTCRGHVVLALKPLTT